MASRMGAVSFWDVLQRLEEEDKEKEKQQLRCKVEERKIRGPEERWIERANMHREIRHMCLEDGASRLREKTQELQEQRKRQREKEEEEEQARKNRMLRWRFSADDVNY